MPHLPKETFSKKTHIPAQFRFFFKKYTLYLQKIISLTGNK